MMRFEGRDRVFRLLKALLHCVTDLKEVAVISGSRCWQPRSSRVWLALGVNSTGTLRDHYFLGSPKNKSVVFVRVLFYFSFFFLFFFSIMLRKVESFKTSFECFCLLVWMSWTFWLFCVFLWAECDGWKETGETLSSSFCLYLSGKSNLSAVEKNTNLSSVCPAGRGGWTSGWRLLEIDCCSCRLQLADRNWTSLAGSPQGPCVCWQAPCVAKVAVAEPGWGAGLWS